MTMEKKLKIAHFTDPLCFWCYAMEPEMRKIRVLLGDQLEYRIVMGVLSSGTHEIIGEDAEVRFEIYRAMLANYFREAMKMVGMPLSPSTGSARWPRARSRRCSRSTTRNSTTP